MPSYGIRRLYAAGKHEHVLYAAQSLSSNTYRMVIILCLNKTYANETNEMSITDTSEYQHSDTLYTATRAEVSRRL